MRCGTYDGVTIDGGFQNITKGDIAALGKRLEWTILLLIPAIRGEKHCGKCGTLRERREAMAEARNRRPHNI